MELINPTRPCVRSLQQMVMAGTVSFQSDAGLTTPLWREMEAILDGGGYEDYFSVSMTMATKRMNWLLCPPWFQKLDYVMSLSRFSTSTGVARKSRHNGRELCTRMAVVVDMAGPVCLLLSLCLDKGSTPAI